MELLVKNSKHRKIVNCIFQKLHLRCGSEYLNTLVDSKLDREKSNYRSVFRQFSIIIFPFSRNGSWRPKDMNVLASRYSYRSSHFRCFIKQVFLQISQNSRENTCTRVSFLTKLVLKNTLEQALSCEFCEICKKTSFTKQPLATYSEVR